MGRAVSRECGPAAERTPGRYHRRQAKADASLPADPVRSGGVRPRSDLRVRRQVRRGRQSDDARTAGSAGAAADRRAPGAGPPSRRKRWQTARP